jgi:uncharacterized membrane protein YgaE (UPF0421/DUF939 family)
MKRVKLDAGQLLLLLKVAFGSAISIWIAGSLGLLYSPSAGIITLLTIQNTRRETLSVAIRRILAFLLAVMVAFAVFSLMSYTFAAFGIFLLIFVGLCIAFGLKDGIPMNAVLMTHFLIEKHMKPALILNEVLLLLIGMGIGILINMIMPKYKERIRRDQIRVEEEMKKVIRSLAITLRNKNACLIQDTGKAEAASAVIKSAYNASVEAASADIMSSEAASADTASVASADTASTDTQNTESLSADTASSVTASIDTRSTDVKNAKSIDDKSAEISEGVLHMEDTNQESPNQLNIGSLFAGLDELLEGLLVRAYEDAGNTLLNNTKYLVAYLEMRKLQVEVLKSIADHIEAIPVILRQSLPMADFLNHMAASFHELNNVVELLAELKELNDFYRKEALPTSREEFEYRAILFQVLKDLKYFLLLKRKFVKELEIKNIKGYWN